MLVELHPEAEREISATALWYEKQAENLGKRFLLDLDATFRRLQEKPMIGVPFEGATRRLFVRRFPYSVIYRVKSDRIQIVAVAHFRRQPGYWKNRDTNGPKS